MPVTAWSAVLIAASVFLPGSVGEVEPTEAARAAISTLTAPSVPQPLPGSVTLDDGVYRFDGDCAQAISKYLGPDAPVPSGATVRQQGQTVVVELPYATSGVSFQTNQGSCQYMIANAPTIRVDGAGAGVPAGDAYGPVLCSEKSDTTELAVAAELFADGAPVVLIVREAGAGVVPGTFSAVFASGQEPPVRLAVRVVSPDLEKFEFVITDAGASARVTGRCTGSVFQFLGGA